MTSLFSLFRRHAAWLVVLAVTWTLAACGGRTDDSPTVPALTGGAAGSGGGGAGKSGTAGATAGSAGNGGAAGKAGGAAGTAGTGGKSGAAGTAGTAGTAGKSGAAGAAGTAGKSGAAGAGGATVTIVSVSVAPAQSTVSIGTGVALTATALGSDGSKQDVTKTATWSSSSPSVKVAAGVATGVSAGNATITATFSGKSATASVTVSSATPTKLTVAPKSATLAVSGTQQLAATLLLSDGSSQDVTKTAAWQSADAGVASVSAGLVTAEGAGTADVTVSLSGLSDTSTITVSAATLVSISISPSNPTVVVGASQQLTATGTFSDGSVGDVSSTVAWSSSDPGLSVSTVGLANATAAGTSIVTATLGGVSGATTVTMTSAKVQSITVSPASASVAAGGTVQLTATATFSDGSTSDVTASAVWQSSAPTTAGVSNAAGSSGLVTGLAPGAATVTASLGGAAGSSKITVIAGMLTSLTISPASPTVPTGSALQLTATGKYSDGSTTDETTSVTWTITDAAIATVDNAPSAGKLSGLAVGTTTVTASLNGVTATATVTVSDAALTSIVVSPAAMSLASGKKDNLTATAVFSDGTQLDVTEQAVWTSSAAGTVTVSNAVGVRGQISAVSAGSADVTATYQGAAGSATITVTQPAVTQLAISPTNQTRAVGQQQQFQAVAIYDNGTQQNVTMQTMWSSSNPSVASVNMMGRVNAVAPGTVTITATWNGITASTTFIVSGPVVLQQVVVSPINPTYIVGTKTPFSAVAIYTDGTSMDVGPQCSWSSSTPSVATVSTGMGPMKGLVTAVAPGEADIVCNYQGLSGSSTVTVTAAVVDVLVISPGAFTGGVGSATQFTAQIIYNDGTSMDVTQQSTWLSDGPSIATVTTGGGGPMGMGPRGQAVGVSAGTATISATYMGLSATATFTVSSATLTSISINPPDATSPIGVNVKLTATAIYSDGSSQDVTNQTTWVSSEPGVAGISNAMGPAKGLVTPISVGKVTITATALGVSATTSFTVAAATLVSIEVTPFAPTLPIGYVTPFFATGIYSDSTTLDLTNLVTWQSTNTGAASVSNGMGTRGRVTPIAAGTASIEATYGGVTGSTALTVTDAQLVSITITPADASTKVGQTTQMSATGDFGGGLALDVSAYVTWSSSNTSVTAISNANNTRGQAKGLAVGVVTITAVRGVVSGTTSLTVN